MGKCRNKGNCKTNVQSKKGNQVRSEAKLKCKSSFLSGRRLTNKQSGIFNRGRTSGSVLRDEAISKENKARAEGSLLGIIQCVSKKNVDEGKGQKREDTNGISCNRQSRRNDSSDAHTSEDKIVKRYLDGVRDSPDCYEDVKIHRSTKGRKALGDMDILTYIRNLKKSDEKVRKWFQHNLFPRDEQLKMKSKRPLTPRSNNASTVNEESTISSEGNFRPTPDGKVSKGSPENIINLSKDYETHLEAFEKCTKRNFVQATKKISKKKDYASKVIHRLSKTEKEGVWEFPSASEKENVPNFLNDSNDIIFKWFEGGFTEIEESSVCSKDSSCVSGAASSSTSSVTPVCNTTASPATVILDPLNMIRRYEQRIKVEGDTLRRKRDIRGKKPLNMRRLYDATRCSPTGLEELNNMNRENPSKSLHNYQGTHFDSSSSVTNIFDMTTSQPNIIISPRMMIRRYERKMNLKVDPLKDKSGTTRIKTSNLQTNYQSSETALHSLTSTGAKTPLKKVESFQVSPKTVVVNPQSYIERYEKTLSKIIKKPSTMLPKQNTQSDVYQPQPDFLKSNSMMVNENSSNSWTYQLHHNDDSLHYKNYTQFIPSNSTKNENIQKNPFSNYAHQNIYSEIPTVKEPSQFYKQNQDLFPQTSPQRLTFDECHVIPSPRLLSYQRQTAHRPFSEIMDQSSPQVFSPAIDVPSCSYSSKDNNFYVFDW